MAKAQLKNNGIKFYDNTGQLISKYYDTCYEIYETSHRELIVYVNYKIKDSEESITISFDAYDPAFNEFYPIQYDNGSELITYKRTLTEGKYRIPIQLKENEKKCRINIEVNGDASSIGDIDIKVAKIYFRKPIFEN